MQIMAETSLLVRPRYAEEQTFQVTSADVPRILPHVIFRVTAEFDPRTAGRNAPDFAVRSTPEAGSRAAFRTAPGTVPGTVPKVTPRATAYATSPTSNSLLVSYLASQALT